MKFDIMLPLDLDQIKPEVLVYLCYKLVIIRR